VIRRLFVVLLVVLLLPSSIRAQESTPVPETTQNGLTIHVVQRGETLFRIALNYGITVEELAQINGITDPSNILVGQRLLVPSGTTSTSTEAITHVVQPGETLRSIAESYGTTVESLAALNNITDVNTIYVGQVLNITPPVETAVPTPTDAPQPDTISAPVSGTMLYTVQAGETLFRIATRFGISVNELATANNITDPSLIFAGQQLIIPGFEPPHLALDLPEPINNLSVNPLLLVEGQAAWIRLTTSEAATMSGTFLDRVLNVITEQGGMTHNILIGVALGTQAGIYPLSLNVTRSDGQQVSLSVNLQILTGGYGSENIILLEDREDLLDPSVDQAELDLITPILNTYTQERFFAGSMGLPAAAAVTSPFGTIRSYDGGVATRRHTGTDFAGAPGTPVLAAASGRVVLADTLNVRGNAVIIDHGWGVFTGYWHQFELYVQVGDMVTTGQIIGTIGATGRVTGAHLHWEVWVSGVPVDPMQWVQLSFP
jgi:murein DD-endopeptidase MepM/ murein hydrolase activator NlpD